MSPDLTPYPFGERQFFELVDRPKLRGGNLEDLSGEKLKRAEFRSSLIERIEGAWVKPFAALTCHEVCCLLGQGMIMPWLAAPLLDFVSRYPAAECGYYPGDMLANFLRNANDAVAVMPREMREWATSDLEALEAIFEWSPPGLKEFRKLLQTLRLRVS